MHIIFTGGGTAGHINPAIAMAEEMRRRFPFAEITFIGTPHGMEKELVTKAGFPLREIDVMGFRRSFSAQNFRAAFLSLTSVHKAKNLLLRMKPSLVVGTGGYVCWPALRAAVLLGIPTAIHESNAHPGLTVRRLEKDMDLILLNFQETAAGLSHPERCRVVGNPTRNAFTGTDRNRARERLGIPRTAFVLLSFGGSQGSSTLNRVMADVMRTFSVPEENVWHMHAVGMRNAADAEAFLPVTRRYAPRIRAERYLHDMPLWLSAADLAVCRSGAMTVSELALTGCPAILVPSPNVAEDHQTANARIFADRGAAVLMPESDLATDRLADEIRSLHDDGEKRRKMRNAMLTFAKPNATEEAVSLLEKELRSFGN